MDGWITADRYANKHTEANGLLNIHKWWVFITAQKYTKPRQASGYNPYSWEPKGAPPKATPPKK